MFYKTQKRYRWGSYKCELDIDQQIAFMVSPSAFLGGRSDNEVMIKLRMIFLSSFKFPPTHYKILVEVLQNDTDSDFYANYSLWLEKDTTVPEFTSWISRK